MKALQQREIQSSLLCGEAQVFDEIDSTNEYLLQHCHNLPLGSVCIAESQTAGRGRRGRQWYSPVGQNLYFSLLWRYERLPENSPLSSLSLVVALIIAESFQNLGVADIQIKWPNDIYYQGKKMGGILIESKMDSDGAYLIIGIGLNLSMQTVDERVVTQAWSDLSAYHFDRNELLKTLLPNLQKMLENYPLVGFAPYQTRWNGFDLFYQKPVKLVTEQNEIHGISLGVNQNGELLLQQGENLTAFAIGEMSLRAE